MDKIIHLIVKELKCGKECPEYMGLGCELNSDAMVLCKRMREYRGEKVYF